MSTDRPTETPSGRKKIPLLVWIIAAALVAWAVIYFMQRSGEAVSPQGGTHPTSAQGDAVAPAAPATTTAPATPQTEAPGG